MVLIRSKAFVHLKLLLTLFRCGSSWQDEGNPHRPNPFATRWIFRKYNKALRGVDETEIQLNLLCMKILRMRQVLIASTNCSLS